MEEASERIVKLYLETKGFLVKTNEKIKVEKNKFLEADIIAIRNVKKNDKLPNKIIGEVKSWSISPKHFSGLDKDYSKKSQNSFKYHNNHLFKKKMLSEIESKFGKGFKFAIFSRPPSKKHSKTLHKFFKKEKIFYLDHVSILKEIIKNLNEFTYSNDSELMMLRLLKRYKLISFIKDVEEE